MTLRRIKLGAVVVAVLASLWLVEWSRAQGPEGTPPGVETGTTSSSQGAAATEEGADSPQTLWEILSAGGIVGMLIMLLSIAAAALVIEFPDPAYST